MPDNKDELINSLKYEIEVLKGKLDEKQKVNIGLTPTFSFNPAEIKSPEDYVKMITIWGFHRGNWQNFITPEDLDIWIETLKSTNRNQLKSLKAKLPKTTDIPFEFRGPSENAEIAPVIARNQAITEVNKILDELIGEK